MPKLLRSFIRGQPQIVASTKWKHLREKLWALIDCYLCVCQSTLKGTHSVSRGQYMCYDKLVHRPLNLRSALCVEVAWNRSVPAYHASWHLLGKPTAMKLERCCWKRHGS